MRNVGSQVGMAVPYTDINTSLRTCINIPGVSLGMVLAPPLHLQRTVTCMVPRVCPRTEYDYSKLPAVVNSRRVGRLRHARTVPVHQSPFLLEASVRLPAPSSLPVLFALRSSLIPEASNRAYCTPSCSPELHSSCITPRRPGTPRPRPRLDQTRPSLHLSRRPPQTRSQAFDRTAAWRSVLTWSV